MGLRLVAKKRQDPSPRQRENRSPVHPRTAMNQNFHGASPNTPSPRPSPRQRGEGEFRSPRPFGERVRVRGIRPGQVLLDALIHVSNSQGVRTWAEESCEPAELPKNERTGLSIRHYRAPRADCPNNPRKLTDWRVGLRGTQVAAHLPRVNCRVVSSNRPTRRRP